MSILRDSSLYKPILNSFPVEISSLTKLILDSNRIKLYESYHEGKDAYFKLSGDIFLNTMKAPINLPNIWEDVEIPAYQKLVHESGHLINYFTESINQEVPMSKVVISDDYSISRRLLELMKQISLPTLEAGYQFLEKRLNKQVTKRDVSLIYSLCGLYTIAANLQNKEIGRTVIYHDQLNCDNSIGTEIFADVYTLRDLQFFLREVPNLNKEIKPMIDLIDFCLTTYLFPNFSEFKKLLDKG